MRLALFFVLLFSYSCFSQSVSYHLTHCQGLPSDVVYDVEADSTGFVWIGTEDGLVRYDGFNYRIIEKLGSKSLLHVPIHALDVSGGIIAFAVLNELFVYDDEIGETQVIKSPFQRITKIEVTREHVFCAGEASSFVWGYEMNSMREIAIHTELGLPVANLTAFNDSVYVLAGGRQFRVDIEKSSMSEVETGLKVFLLVEESSAVYTAKQIMELFNVKPGKIEHLGCFVDGRYTFLVKKDTLFYNVGAKRGRVLLDAQITACDVDRYGNLWLATDSEGVKFFSGTSFLPSATTEIPQDVSVADKARDISYTLSDDGIRCFVSSSGVEVKSSVLEQFNELDYMPVHIAQNEKGDLIVSDKDTKIYKIDCVDGLFEVVDSLERNMPALEIFGLTAGYAVLFENSLVFNDADSSGMVDLPLVYDAAEDDSLVWLATVSGLWVFNKQTYKTESWEKRVGYSFGKLTSVYKAGENEFWFAQSDRFYSYNIVTDRLESYSSYVTTGDIEASSLTVNDDSVFYRSGGVAWAVSRADLLNDSSRLMPLKVVDAKILGGYVDKGLSELKFIKKESTEGIKEVAVAYTNTFSSFYFNALDYSHSVPYRIRYRLEGYDSNWHWADDVKMSVNYTSLHGGDYVLQSEVVDLAGNVVAKGQDMLFLVEYAFWETWWFILTTLLVVAMVVYFAYNARVSRVVRMRTMLEKQVNQRTVELQDRNEEIRQQKEVLLAQRDEANKQKSEIVKQKELLEQQQHQLEKYADVQKQALLRSETQMKQIEEKKDYYESIYHLVSESTRDVVFRLKLPEEVFDYVSPSLFDLSGYYPEELYESKGVFWKMFAPDFKDYGQMMRQNLKVGEIRPVSEYEIVCKDGSHKWVKLKSVLVKDKLSNPVALEGVICDVSKEKKEEFSHEAAKHRIKEANVLKTAFLEKMSHKLRTPMSTIVGFSDLLSDPDISLDERQGYLEHINESSNALLLMIDDLIDFSKLEASQIEINNSQCYVNSIIKNVQSSFDAVRVKNGLDELKIECSLGVKEDSFAILTDTFRLKQILTKLVGNALQFTEKGLIEVGYRLDSEDESQSLLFFVKDTGKGIPADKLSKVFDRYTSLKNSAEAEVGKLNLGLAIARSLVELLGGKIWVESKVGVGSVFWFSLPFEKQKGIKTKLVSESKSFVEDWANRTFLVAEDEDNNYRFIKAALKKTGVNLVRAKDGQEAVAVFEAKHNSIDLVLMDIQMPVMNGYEATQKIKIIDKNVPIIAQTAFAMTGGKVRCFDAGCDGYISKPYKAKDIIATISKYLEF